MNFIKNPTVIIVILGLLVGGGFYFYNNYRNKQKAAEEAKQQEAASQPVITNLTNADPNDFTTEIQKELDLASQKAIAYNSKEALSALEITIPGDLVPRSGNVSYVYDSADDQNNHYVVNIDQATQAYLRAVIPKEDYFGNLTGINLKSWRLSYIEALKVAEQNGGQDFRNNNELQELRLVLKNGDPKGWLYWTVQYKSQGNGFEAQVDAFSGRFVSPEEITAAQSQTTDSN